MKYQDEINFIKLLIGIVLLLAIFTSVGCVNYSTSLRTSEKDSRVEIDKLRKGKACSHNLFGGFTLPQIKNTAVKISGSEALIDAMKDAQITRIVFQDSKEKSYLVYTIKCTIVWGD